MSIKSRETASLSARELDVLHWMCDGKSNWEISQILGLSQHTVKHHVSNILNKLEVSNRQNAAIKGIELDLVAYEV